MRRPIPAGVPGSPTQPRLLSEQSLDKTWTRCSTWRIAPSVEPTAADLRDHAAFSRAYAQHARAVHAAAMAVLNDHARAQDVVQDVFLRLWRRPDAFDGRRGALGPYLRVMARSRALDLWRETEVRRRAGDRLGHTLGAALEAPDARLAPERHDLRAALRTLPDGAAGPRGPPRPPPRPGAPPGAGGGGRCPRVGGGPSCCPTGGGSQPRGSPATPTSRSARRRAASASACAGCGAPTPRTTRRP